MTLRFQLRAVTGFSLGLLLAGCGQQTPAVKTAVAAKGVSGGVHGGQNPVTGATIQLWQVNTTADGGLGTAMLTHTVTSSDGTGTTNSNANTGNAFNTLPAGDFTITGAYTCPAPGTLVYITASGGNPGLIAGTNNPQSQMVTALGTCNNLKTNVQFIEISEQTTVATVASLYAFMSAYNAIGASPAHAADMTAAFTLMNEYIDFQAATAPGPALPAGYSASTGDLNLLANVLATCVNSAGGTYNDNSPCGTLFYQADPTPTNSTPAPTDVTRAALDIRRNYTVYAGNIATLPAPQAPFQPASTAGPSDWTLPIFQLPPAPTISLATGSYSSAQQIVIQDADPSALVYFHFSNPGDYFTALGIYDGRQTYQSPITVVASQTLSAVAVAANGRAFSAVTYATYTLPTPANTPLVQIYPITPQPFGSTAPITVTAGTSPSTGSTVTFAASNALGGSFSPTSCTFAAGGGYCPVTYTPSGSAPVGTYEGGITASFSAANGYTSATASTNFYIVPPVTLTPFAATGAPSDGLIQASDGSFYGVQQSPSSPVSGQFQVSKLDSSGNTTAIYTSTDTNDGLDVFGSLIQGTDGSFYGSATQGGFSGNGTIFKIDPSGNFTLLYTFTGALDGGSPTRASLVQGTDGGLYGMTSAGGANGYGTIFKTDTSGNFTLLHAFAAGTDGALPEGGLIQAADGNFYGMTDIGGTYDAGTIIRMDSSGNVTTLHSFSGLADGGSVNDGGQTRGVTALFGGLVQAADGDLYGTTILGGSFRLGTLFKIDTSGNLTTVHNFTFYEARLTQALVQGTDGALYGEGVDGGFGYGQLFKIDSTGNFTELYSFENSSDGYAPNGPLVQGSDGSFYGTDYSNFFKLTPSPALPGPITLTVPSSVTHGSPFTLSYTVYNASSATMQHCFATNTGGDVSGWTGIKTASTSATNANLTAPSIAGTYTYSLTCGGIESGFATLHVQ